jgi:hypothetical protein
MVKSPGFGFVVFSVASFTVLGVGCSSGDNGPGPATAGTTSTPTAGSASSGSGSGGSAASGAPSGGSASVAGAAGQSSAAGASGSSSGGAAGSSAAGTGNGGASAGSGGGGGSGGSGVPSTEKFSFFVTSMASLLELAKAKDATATVGFGGDLTYGEVGAGAGLRGADKICTAIAEKGMPGNNKVWRAFLSATDDGSGQPVNAISRIGTGPWYDRTGRVVAMNVAGLKGTRPMGGDATIADDLPNEFGVPNHQPNIAEDEVDNHDTVTGSNAQGELGTMTKGSTCNDWTSKVGNTGKPMCGHSWPRSANQSWIATHAAGGCAPGVNIFGSGGPAQGDLTIGAGGGYGGFYCFALTP